MIRPTIVAAALCLAAISTGCSSRRSDPPPELIRVPVYVPLPDACYRLPALVIPDGASSEDLERALYAHVLELRAQIRACRLETR